MGTTKRGEKRNRGKPPFRLTGRIYLQKWTGCRHDQLLRLLRLLLLRLELNAGAGRVARLYVGSGLLQRVGSDENLTFEEKYNCALIYYLMKYLARNECGSHAGSF